MLYAEYTNLWIFLKAPRNHYTLKPGDQICTSHVSHLIFLQFRSYLADYQNCLKRLDERDSLSQFQIHDRYEVRSMMPTFTPSTRHQPPCNLAGAQSIHDDCNSFPVRSIAVPSVLSRKPEVQISPSRAFFGSIKNLKSTLSTVSKAKQEQQTHSSSHCLIFLHLL